MEQERWDQLVSASRPRLLAFAKKLTAGDSTLAEDLVQDALLQAWTKRLVYDPSRSFERWVAGILVNKHKDYLRKPSNREMPIQDLRHPDYSTPWSANDGIEDDVDPANAALGKLTLKDMLATLRGRPRKVAILLSRGYNHKEAARMVGLSFRDYQRVLRLLQRRLRPFAPRK